MTTKIFKLNNSYEWKSYLCKLPDEKQDIYYNPEYYSIYEDYGDGKSRCFVYEKDGELALYPFLINSINKLGYDLDDEYYDIQGAYGYNGVLSSSYDKEFSDGFYNAFSEWCQNNNIIAEFTRFNPYLENHIFSNVHLQVLLNRKTVVLNLNDSIENLWKNSFSSKNRNMIRKALKNGYSVTIDNSEKGVRDFYKIYLGTMKGIKTDPYYYFNEDMFLKMFENSTFQFLFAEDKDNSRIASMILMVYGKYAHYHLSGRNIEIADNSVNNFLLYEATKTAKEKGAEIFHFGGGNTLDENDLLFRFKKGFSKSYLDFYIGKKIYNQKIYDIIHNQWREKHPESFNKYKNMILGYQEIN